MQVQLPLWLDYIEQQIGFILPKNQHQWLANAINGTAVKHGLSLEQLYEQVQKDDDIRQSLFDSVLIAESRFFRDVGALQFIAKQYAQHLVANRPEPFLVASIGCATGQEVWSVAMVLERTFRTIKSNATHLAGNYRVLGLDVSKSALETAKTATYTASCLQQIPPQYRPYIKESEQNGETVWQPTPAVQARAEFVWCNVFAPDGLTNSLNASGFKHTQPQLIICQNMLIYFRRFDQRDILGRLVDLLADNGHLILSAVDGTFWRHDQMQRLHYEGASIWHKDNEPSTLG